MPLRGTGGGMQGASARAGQPDAASGRVDAVVSHGWAWVRQDQGGGGMGALPRREQAGESNCPRRIDGGRCARRDGRRRERDHRRAAGPTFRPQYLPSLGRVTWPNGVIATCFSADEPERLRGPQHDHAWIDEPGAWRYGREAFDMLMFGLRLGEHPRVCVTTTPRATALIKALVADPKTHLSRGTTYDNRPHLFARLFSRRSSRNTRGRGWASRNSTPSCSRSPKGRGSRCSRWRGTFRARLSFILPSTFEWPLMPAPPGIPAPSCFNCDRINRAGQE